MRLTPHDIANFGYCPYLYWRRGTAGVVPPLSIFEKTMRQTILVSEMKALKNNTLVTPRSLGNTWERLWWPAASKAGIPLDEAESASLKAGYKFTDYCKYDISGPSYATIGTNIPFEMQMQRAVLAGEVDMIKLQIERANDHLVFMDFTRKKITNVQVANDLAILSTLYALHELDKNITYICIDISESLIGLGTSSSYFTKEDIKGTGHAVQYLVEGIYRHVDYKPIWTCRECTKCDFK